MSGITPGLAMCQALLCPLLFSLKSQSRVLIKGNNNSKTCPRKETLNFEKFCVDDSRYFGKQAAGELGAPRVLSVSMEIGVRKDAAFSGTMLQDSSLLAGRPDP